MSESPDFRGWAARVASIVVRSYLALRSLLPKKSTAMSAANRIAATIAPSLTCSLENPSSSNHRETSRHTSRAGNQGHDTQCVELTFHLATPGARGPLMKA
jgi:hypothetical protein